jgi:hypothetical protein
MDRRADKVEVNMSAILLAVFDDHPIAERVRVALVRDGFPTDRVELTAWCEPGRAGLAPADSPHDKFVQYFGVLFTLEGERHYAEQLAERVEKGAATITVHPRGAIETARALAILGDAGAVQVISHHLANQMLERAAARHERPWIRNFWIDTTSEADCIYCRLFEGASN